MRLNSFKYREAVWRCAVPAYINQEVLQPIWGVSFGVSALWAEDYMSIKSRFIDISRGHVYTIDIFLAGYSVIN